MFHPIDFTLEAVIFTPSKTKIPGVRTEYYIYESGVKFHLWKDPEFPEGLGDNIKTAWKSFPSESVIAEYVPEVDSWYAEVKDLSMGLSDALVESLLKKVVKEANRNGTQT